MHAQQGPGGRGSIPALVMRSGLIQPVSPRDARRDLTLQHVLDVTTMPGHVPYMPAGGAITSVTPVTQAPPNAVTTSVAETMVAPPPTAIQTAPTAPPANTHSSRYHWQQQHRRVHPAISDIRRLHPSANLHDAEAPAVVLGEHNGRPLAKFAIAASPSDQGAQAAASALRRAAQTLRMTGLAALPPEIIGGPLAALMRGGAVELHFTNGATVRTAI